MADTTAISNNKYFLNRENIYYYLLFSNSP